MRTIRVRKDELLRALEKNRQKYRGIFLKAQEKYREMAIAELDKMLKDARSGKQFHRSISLVQPQDHMKDYDRAIQMVKWSVDDTLELNETEFAAYVQNRWEWLGSFRSTSEQYAGAAMFMDFAEGESEETG